jgi:predicted RNA-binding Zn-ribbon protein involved in translation (DUF1610 family)
MFEPEIARRCSSCGASVRQRASFCPQCGQVVVKQQTDSQADSQTTPVEGPDTQFIAAPSEGSETQIIAAPSEGSETQIIAVPSEGSETQIISAPSEGSETQIIAAPSEGYETQILVALPEVSPVAPEEPEASDMSQTDPAHPEELRSPAFPMVAETQPLITQTIQREPTVSEADNITAHPAIVARPGMEQHLMDRVDRIRKVSSVVIDQAAYDPSLRFLLVAAVLFILFVILMVLSKVIG